MDMKESRIGWIESLKLLASLLVFTTHFLAEFKGEWLVYWGKGQILYGVSGKLAVSFFFLMAGFFAMKANKDNTWKYITKRYVRFVVPIFLIEIIMFLLLFCSKRIGIDTWLSASATDKYARLYGINLKMIIYDTFLLDCSAVITYWCNGMLFLGPVIVMLLHGFCDEVKTEPGISAKLKTGIIFGLSAIITAVTGNVWYTICIIGAFLYLVVHDRCVFFEKWRGRLVKAGLLPISYICIRTPETESGYLWKAVAVASLFLIVFYSKWIQVILENRIFCSVSKYSFEIYLLHMPVNWIIITVLYGLLENKMNSIIMIAVLYLTSLGLTILFSIKLKKVSDQIVKKLYAGMECVK